MTISLTQKIVATGVVLVAIIGIGLYTSTVYTNKSLSFGSGALDMRYVVDFSDDKNVLGSFHNVFVGKIINKVKQTDVQGIPVTLFEAEVIHNLSGNLEGTVIVLQTAGYRETPEGVRFASIAGDRLMQPGETYLLATGYDELVTGIEGRDIYTILTHPNGSKLLSEDSTLTTAKLKFIAEQDEKVKAWEEVYKNENLLNYDVLNNNTRNSY